MRHGLRIGGEVAPAELARCDQAAGLASDRLTLQPAIGSGRVGSHFHLLQANEDLTEFHRDARVAVAAQIHLHGRGTIAKSFDAQVVAAIGDAGKTVLPRRV